MKWLTLAFMLSDGGCTPKWDGSRALTGGSDQSAIDAIRSAGGDVVVSFGGWSGDKLGEHCSSASTGSHHIARLTFWAVNRDRQCSSGGASDSCSGVSQSAYAYTKIFARYTG